VNQRDELEDEELDDDAWDKPPEPGTFDIGLDGRRWNVDRFLALERVLPEKMELIDGKLFWSERERLGMLSAMLEQVGLREAVKLAPKELWLNALRQAEE
jgi:hypothetical protein